MTELDKKLQEIACKNWPQFVALIGGEALIGAKTCLLRSKNKSYGAIAMQLQISRDKARYGCEKCDVPPTCDDDQQ